MVVSKGTRAVRGATSTGRNAQNPPDSSIPVLSPVDEMNQSASNRSTRRRIASEVRLVEEEVEQHLLFAEEQPRENIPVVHQRRPERNVELVTPPPANATPNNDTLVNILAMLHEQRERLIRVEELQNRAHSDSTHPERSGKTRTNRGNANDEAESQRAQSSRNGMPLSQHCSCDGYANGNGKGKRRTGRGGGDDGDGGSPSHHTGRGEGRPDPPPLIRSRGPFARQVSSCKIPKALEKPPKLDSYDGHGDPDEHIDVVLDYYGTRGAVKCKLFALTLKGTAVAGFLRHTPLQLIFHFQRGERIENLRKERF
ncbi:hypothetical protein QL285_032920 [Trifolium repens]|nr:hypothetical protein QL285_032920 [Trifolium repens]